MFTIDRVQSRCDRLVLNDARRSTATIPAGSRKPDAAQVGAHTVLRFAKFQAQSLLAAVRRAFGD